MVLQLFEAEVLHELAIDAQTYKSRQCRPCCMLQGSKHVLSKHVLQKAHLQGRSWAVALRT